LRRTERRGPRVLIRPLRHPGPLGALLVALSLGASGACTSDPADRWLYQPDEAVCTVGSRRCAPELEVCEKVEGVPAWTRLENCSKQDLVCSVALGACASCVPDQRECQGAKAMRCLDDGSGWEELETCDESAGYACRLGACVQLCAEASRQRSNVGCEYWPVDLDNANVDDTLNAAAQQFAVVISNAQPDVTAQVIIEQDDSQPGDDNEPYVIAETQIPPLSLRVFPLGPREVDGSAPGKFNAGTHSALTRAAYRVRSSFPVVAYQFNPLENVGVFSNDASLLKPREAVEPEGEGMQTGYVVVGWPQTIAHTDDPRTNFTSTKRVDLRAFLTVVGTRPNTTVRIRSSTHFVGAPGIPETEAGGELEVTLDPFDVLNLETEGFNEDFTGTVIESDRAVIAYSGSEASDAPYFSTLGQRFCCADHLEEQLDHVRTAGNRFILSPSPSRTDALIAAGAAVGRAEQAEYFRVVATTDAGARLSTSIPEKADILLPERGAFYDIASQESFTLTSDHPVSVMSISPSQEAAGVPRDLPGGDPSSLIIPPVEQFRSTYVFLTPSAYAFDFVRIAAPASALIAFDGRRLEDLLCTTTEAGSLAMALGPPEPYVVYTCQLGFPVVDPMQAAPDNFHPGSQNDGVHVIESDRDIGVLVDGFDRFVSYAYAAGTELSFIVPR
jgi:hypothetical protein